MTVRAPAQVVAHPLQRLGADEIRLARAVLAEPQLPPETGYRASGCWPMW